LNASLGIHLEFTYFRNQLNQGQVH